MPRTIKLTLNAQLRQASKGPNQGSKFLSCVGLLDDRGGAIEFDVNGPAVETVSGLCDAFRSKGFAPIVTMDVDGITETPVNVPATTTAPAHVRTWAGKPVFRLVGSAKITAVVGKERLPTVEAAIDPAAALALLDA